MKQALQLKPLYLFPCETTFVKLDGSALKVIGKEKAPKYFPLKQLSRVELGKNIVISSNVLLACIKYGINVTLYDKKSAQPLATLFSQNRTRNSFNRRLIAYSELIGWRQHYQDWKIAYQTKLQRENLVSIGYYVAKKLDARQLQLLFNKIQQYSEPYFSMINKLLISEIVRLLHRSGLNYQDGFILGPELDLASDMASLTTIQMIPAILRVTQSPFMQLLAHETDQTKTAIRIMETHKETSMKNTIEHIKQLNTFLSKELLCQ